MSPPIYHVTPVTSHWGREEPVAMSCTLVDMAIDKHGQNPPRDTHQLAAHQLILERGAATFFLFFLSFLQPLRQLKDKEKHTHSKEKLTKSCLS